MIYKAYTHRSNRLIWNLIPWFLHLRLLCCFIETEGDSFLYQVCQTHGQWPASHEFDMLAAYTTRLQRAKTAYSPEHLPGSQTCFCPLYWAPGRGGLFEGLPPTIMKLKPQSPASYRCCFFQFLSPNAYKIQGAYLLCMTSKICECLKSYSNTSHIGLGPYPANLGSFILKHSVALATCWDE